ncbi:OR63A protein, partial [Acromyrmex charruanus]
MSFFDNRYYYLNKRFMIIIGQWPFQSRLEGNMLFATAFLFILSLIAFETWGLIAGITDLNIIMENASPLLVDCFMMLKLMNCVLTNNKIKELLKDVEETWKIKHTGPEKEILQHHAKKSKIFAIRYAIIFYAVWLFYTLTPVVISGMYKILPTNKTYNVRFLYRLEHVLDMDKYFNIMMLHGFISIFYIVSVPIALDTTYTLCIQHICALFECLRYNIERIQGSDFIFLQPNIEDDEAYRHIIDCIKSYKHVLKLLILVDKQPDEIIRVLSGNLVQVLHIYFLSLISQKLIDHSSELQNLWGLIAGIGDLSIIMENTSPLLVCTFIITKLINSINNNYKIKELLEHIEETWKVIHEGPENKILLYYAEENKIFTIRYAIGLYAMWLFYTTPPIIVSGIYTLLPTNETYSARFLYRLEHVLDMDKYYNLLMLHGFISVFYIVSVPIAVDNLFTLYIQHVCALFRCIKYNIEQIRGSEFTLLNPDIADDKAYHSIVSCIKLYKRIIKFSDLLSSTYATSFLIMLGNIVICLSFGAAELIMVDNQFDEIIRILAANAAQLLHIYYLSLTSQRLIDYSNELQNVIYSCYWYTISLRSRHLLRFTLMRATKPCQIKAGNIFVMSLETFSKVLALVTLHGDFDAIIECIPPLIIDFVCITKLVNLTCNIEKIKILLIHIQRDWRSWTIKSEFEILHKFAESGRTITIAYAGGMYAFGSLFPFLAIIPKIIGKNVTSEYSTRPVGFPYHVEYYVDLEKYYYPILIHNYLTTAIRLTTLVATDTFVTILVQHCCALFSVVRYRLEYIRKSIEQDKELALLEEDDKFYATSRTINPHLAIRHASYIIAQLLHLYIVCWLGQQEVKDRMGDIDQFFQNSHYNIIRLLLNISGLWPFHTRSRRYTIYTILMLIFGSGFIFELAGIIEIRHNFFEVIDNLPLLFFAILIISKILCAVHTLPKIKILLLKMQEYCLSPKSDEETKIQNLHAQHGRKLGYAYTGHSILYLFATLLSRVLHVESEEADETNNVQRGLPFRINSMIDLDTYYVPIFIHCSICEFMYMFLLTVIDVLYLTVVEYCYGLFAALRYRLETALVFENERLTIMFTKDKIINNMENISGGINNYVYLNGLLLNVLFENWQGQKIVDSSEKVFKSAYNTKWYNMPVAARKLLIMIMMRSEKPSALKVGKIIVLSYVTFNAVLALVTLYGDFDAIIECIPPLVVDFACIIKLVNLTCNTKKVCRRSWLSTMIKYRLEYIRKSIEQDKELALLEEDDKFYKNFTYCIQKHKDVLRFARYLDAIYTKAFFFEVGLIILAMSMSALQATSGTLNPPLVIRHASYITAQLLHLYIVCWLGQQIIDHSDHVYTSTYRGEWYESSPKSRKLLNMIMLRSTSPCTLTVGKIMILSFPSFSAVKLDIIFFGIHRRFLYLRQS